MGERLRQKGLRRGFGHVEGFGLVGIWVEGEASVDLGFWQAQW